MINSIIEEYPLISNMVTENQVRIILSEFEKTRDIKGDIVELGCNIGTTSLFIQIMLLKFGQDKRFHVYDSFEGLPEKSEHDNSDRKDYFYTKGSCASNELNIVNNFVCYKLPVPEIHKGWFIDQDYPEKISFAFLDSDFYSSITDSLNKVYSRLTKGAIMCIHDYQWDALPGVEKACIEFFKDKPETLLFNNYIGIMIKQ